MLDANSELKTKLVEFCRENDICIECDSPYHGIIVSKGFHEKTILDSLI